MNIGNQIQKHREHVLSDRLRAVSADVTNDDVPFLRRVEIHIVDSGGDHLNQFEIGSGVHFGASNHDFVCQNDLGICNTRGRFSR